MKYLIISSEKHIGKINEDLGLANALNSLGKAVEVIAWEEYFLNKASVAGDILILKSIWGYHLRIEDFTSWLSDVHQSSKHVINSKQVFDWNVDKSSYLPELETNGICIVPTYIKKDLNSDDYSKLVKKLHSSSLVLKPSISASGDDTSIISNEEEYSTYFLNHTQLVAAGKSILVQPYIESISRGEISVFCIAGSSRYGFRRFPGVLAEKQGSEYIPYDDIPQPINKIVGQVKDFLIAKFTEIPVIMRLDFVEEKGNYLLMECELIDPDLYSRHLPESNRTETLDLLAKEIIERVESDG